MTVWLTVLSIVHVSVYVRAGASRVQGEISRLWYDVYLTTVDKKHQTRIQREAHTHSSQHRERAAPAGHQVAAQSESYGVNHYTR